jgi:hypothetical protein
MPVIPATAGSTNKRTEVRLTLAKRKIARAKWAGGVAQVVKRPPNKHKALSSIPNSTKKRKNQKNKNLAVLL